MTSKKPHGGSSQDPADKPTVYFTRFGRRYVKAEELFRSERVREQVRSMAELFRNAALRHSSDGSGRKDS